jgi:hypothetical protein
MIHVADRAAGARLPAPFPPVTQGTVRNSLELLPSVRYTLYGRLSRGFARNFQRNRKLRNASILSTCYVKHRAANGPCLAWAVAPSPVLRLGCEGTDAI